MLNGLRSWLTGLSRAAKASLILLVAIVGVAGASSHPPVSPSQSSQPKNPQSNCTSTQKTTTETRAIPFSETSVNDPTLAQGKSYVKVAGVNGVRTLAYNNITYSPTGCKPDSKTVVSDVVTTQPVTQVTVIGTYVSPTASDCPNGTYINSAGDVVCSPYSSSTAPAGATAQCLDGTYSFSQSRSGTCSHHGGVAQWL